MSHETLSLNSIRGHVRLFEVDSRDSWRLLGEYDNLILYQAADISSRVLSGDNTYKIDGMFLEFENSAVNPITPGQGNTYANTYATLAGENDIISTHLIGAPSFSTSDQSKYAGNKVLFYGVLAGDSGAGLVGIIQSKSFDATSSIKGASLAAFVDNTGAQQTPEPQLFSRVSISPAVTVLSGLRLGLEWTIQTQ